MIMRLIPVVGLAASLMLGPCPAASGQSEEKPGAARLTVVGHGKVVAVPDVADIIVGVVTQGPTAREALRKNNEDVAALIKALKGRGVVEKDIETSQLQVSPVYSQPAAGIPQGEEFVPKVVGYRVSHAVDVTTRDVAKLGDLLDAVVQAGANQVSGISFRVDKTEDFMDEARRRAMADARRKADLLAREAGVTRGPAVQISESGATAPMGMAPAPMGMAMPYGSRMSPAPIAPGEQELSVWIQVSYAIMPPKS